MLTFPQYRKHQLGLTLLEVLITIVVLSFGLLGLASFEVKMMGTHTESFERAQAVEILNDMQQRIAINGASAASYVTSGSIGTGDSQPSDCTSLTVGPSRDLCEWSALLKGSGETSGANKVGAMISGRACITQVQAPNPATGICTPGIYNVTVAWQGLTPTVTPTNSCGSGSYGANDAYRRIVSARVVVPQNTCT